MKKRVLSLFMAFTLCFSMQPTVAFAGETGVVTEQEVPSSENTTEVYTTGSISDGDVSGGDAGVQDAEKDADVRAAQELINALPDEVTAENAEMIGGQLAAIDEALAALTDEQRAELDMTRYYAICTALTTFVAVQDGTHVDHSICGATDCTGHKYYSPHKVVSNWIQLSYDEASDQLKIGENNWSSTSDGYILPAGNYYLETDLKTDVTIQNSGDVNLCLNGHSITATGNFDVITQTKGVFCLCDCKKDTGKITHQAGVTGRGVCSNGGSFYMFGGTITGNNAGSQLGGGVYVANWFGIFGGTISNNQAKSGGGVYGKKAVNIRGGFIQNNTATLGDGGGVYNVGNNRSDMFDVTITGNKARDNGGGVYLGDQGCFDMFNVTITGNEAGINGGGMMLQTSQYINMKDKVEITGNTVGSNANNLYKDSGRIYVKGTLTDSQIGVSMPAIDENDYVVVAKGASYTLTTEDKDVFVLDDNGAGYETIDVDNSVAFRKGDPHEHAICVNSDCTEAGHDNVVWKGINNLSEITEDGNYYLKKSVSLSSTWTCGRNVNLCLNGYSIIVSTAEDAIKVVSGCTFTLCDCNGSTNGNGKITHASGKSGSGVNVNGSFTMYSGSITGNNTTTNGGGVNVGTSGSFTMYGGSITKNEASGNGGGVNVGANRNFTMYGGSITSNTAYGKGGGVNVDAKGSFAMYGGSINDLNIASDNGGDGVYVGGTMTVGGGAQITGNGGSNVYLSDGQFITVDKALNENAKINVSMATAIAENTYVVIAKGTDTYTLTDQDLNAFASDNIYSKRRMGTDVIFINGALHEHAVCGKTGCTDEDHDNEVWTGISKLSDIASDGSYYLTDNVKLTSTWVCKYNVKLCLNGFAITGASSYDTINVYDSNSLDITDCAVTADKVGKITHESGSGLGINVNGTLTLWNGTITGNKGSNGGGVYVNADGTFIMNGGAVTGNTASTNGGGVYLNQRSTFTMNGGTITGNKAGEGGGVYLYPASCSFTMNGGTITGNNASTNGGGVYVEVSSGKMGTFTVSGEVKITDNWKYGELDTAKGIYVIGYGEANNVFLCGNSTTNIATITIGAGLSEKARIGVSKDKDFLYYRDEVFIIATGATGTMKYTEIFTSDALPETYFITLDGEGNMYLGKHQHSWEYKLGSDSKTITATCVDTTNCPTVDGGSVTIKAPDENTLTYDGSKKTATIENNLLTGENDPTISYTLGSGQGGMLPENSYPTNVGAYTASITVGGVTASVTYEIKKADPAAKDFVFTAPGSLTYDGNAKTAEVKAATNITGMGNVTVKYYQGETEVQPVNVGEYTVKISVTDGTNFNEASGLTDASWAFTIAANTTEPTVELSGNMTYTGEQIKPDVTVTIDGKTLTKGTDYTITYGDNINAGTDAGSVTVKAMGNYGFADFVQNFTIKKADPELSFEKDAVTKTYSDRSQPFANSITRKGDGKVTYSSEDTTVATVDENTGIVTIVSVGTAVITATVAATENYEEGSTSYTLTVNKARLVVNGVIKAKDKTYDGTTDADVEVAFADENNALLYLKPDKDYTVRGTFSSPNASDSAQTVKVEITLMGDCAEKYTLETDTYKAYAYINAKPISIANVLPQNRSYKRNDTSVTIMGVTFNDSTNMPVTTLRNGLDYTVSGKMTDANIGTNKEVAVTVTLQGNAANNYSLASNMTTATVTITKAVGGALTKDNRQQKFSDRKQKTLTPDYTGLPAGETWKYSISGALTSGTAVVEPATINPATGEITYTLTSGAENDTISWTVTISNSNYEDFTKDLVLTLTAKDPQETLRITGDDTVVYGEKLQLSTVGGSGTGELTYSVDAGSTGEATIDADGVLTPVTVGSVVIIATKAGDADYSEITSAPFVIMITPATPDGEPKYNKITTGGRTLAEAGLTLDGSTLTPADGTLVWVDDQGIELPGETEVEVNKTYKWRFTPVNTNYKPLTGEIELYHVDAPAVTAQPKNVSVITGERAVFEVAATGTDVTYQWKIDRNDGNGFVDITGANSASYTSGVTDKDCDGFKYQCVISNAAGSVTTDTVVLTVKEKYIFTATAGEHGSISPSGDVEVVEGSSPTFVITPEEGYEIDSLTVDGNAVSAVTSYTFENVTAAHTIAVTFKIQYRIIDGADSSWTQNTDGSLIIRGNGAFSKFLNVKVDGQVIDPVNYTVREGSTIVELKADYLKTLPEGSHTFELEWTDGSASTNFTVARNTSGGNNNNSNNSNTNNNSIQGKDNSNTAEKAKDPGTGDTSHNVFWYLLTAMSAVGLAVIAFLRNRKKE